MSTTKLQSIIPTKPIQETYFKTQPASLKRAWRGVFFGIPMVSIVMFIVFLLRANASLWAGNESASETNSIMAILSIVVGFGSLTYAIWLSFWDSHQGQRMYTRHREKELTWLRPFISPYPEFTRTRYVPESRVPEEFKYRVIGTAGDLSGAKGLFSDENIRKGEKGEKLTASLLDEAFKRDVGVRIFHGLQWIGSENADVDHAVLCGNNLVLIDSKLWSGSFHYMDGDGQVSSRIKNRPVNRSVKFEHAVEAYKEAFPYLDIDGYVLIHGENHEVDANAHPDAPLGFGMAFKTMGAIRHFTQYGVNPNKPEVNLQAVEDLYELTKSPLVMNTRVIRNG